MYFFLVEKKHYVFLSRLATLYLLIPLLKKKKKKIASTISKKIVISPNNFKIVPIKIFTPLSQTGTYIYVFDNLMVIMEDERFES